MLFPSKSNGQSFKILGTIHSSTANYILLVYFDENHVKQRQVAKVKSGKFRLEGNINGIADAILTTDSNSIYVDSKLYRWFFWNQVLQKYSLNPGK
jgi:hypothetical protein